MSKIREILIEESKKETSNIFELIYMLCKHLEEQNDKVKETLKTSLEAILRADEVTERIRDQMLIDIREIKKRITDLEKKNG